MKVEFLPEPGMLAAIAKEMRSTHKAYPLFSAAKMILNKPQLHIVRVTSLDATMPLYQIGDGPIATDKALVERDAFRLLKDKYYREDVQQIEPPKGNFTNVARLRASGLLLGPTNHHAYQPMLRRIYEERYSRRMPFSEFQSREIEVVNDEQTINDWKEKARSVVTYVTTLEPEPLTFKTQAEVEAHFRQKYLPQEMKSEMSLESIGTAQRNSPDRALGSAIGDAFDKEIPFPASVVNAMRPAMSDAGLTFFKHRKRIVYATSQRPVRHPENQPARETVLAVLRTIEANPRCSRHDLAVKLLGENFDAPEKAQEKTNLAADLHYLLLAGHVIEFVDGRLDLPLPPKAQAEAAKEEAEEATTEGTPEASATEAEAPAASPTPDVPEASAPEPEPQVEESPVFVEEVQAAAPAIEPEPEPETALAIEPDSSSIVAEAVAPIEPAESSVPELNAETVPEKGA